MGANGCCNDSPFRWTDVPSLLNVRSPALERHPDNIRSIGLPWRIKRGSQAVYVQSEGIRCIMAPLSIGLYIDSLGT